MLSDDQYTRKEILMCDLNRKEGDENFNKQKYTKAIKAYGEVSSEKWIFFNNSPT
jgi:hypothetical protein